MSKEIYVDGNGNENFISGTINNASILPISANDSTNTKSYIDNKLADLKTLYTSTTSFVDACSKIGIYAGIGSCLDNLKTNIASYTNNTINSNVDNSQGPIYFMWFGKANDNYFTGILLSYFSDNDRQPVLFNYFNGTYSVRRL